MTDFSAETAMRQGGHAADYQADRAREKFDELFGPNSAANNLQAFAVFSAGFMQAGVIDAGWSYFNVHFRDLLCELNESIID